MKKGIIVILAGAICLLTLVLLMNCGVEPLQGGNENTETMYNANEYTLVESMDYHKIVRYHDLFFCFFTDNAKQVIRQEGPFSKCPTIKYTDNGWCCFTIQAGTGLGTQWGYYYDPVSARFSDVFYSILDQDGCMVACATQEAVVVSEIFEKREILYFSSFTHPFAPMADPIQNAEFIDNGMRIRVDYLTGSDYELVTEEITLPLEGKNP